MNSLKNLQNGTDIRGVAFENDKLEVNLHSENIKYIARGIYFWLKNKLKKSEFTVSIGKDSRITGDRIKNDLINEFSNYDIKILDADLSTTPAMFMSTIWEKYNADCGIMITASHLPYFYNGLKLFTKNGAIEKIDVEEILNVKDVVDIDLLDKNFDSKKNVIKIPLIDDYSKYLVNLIREKTSEKEPLKNMKIIVDAGNGSGGFFAEKVLKVLGADINGSQYLEPNGMFPNHPPNPENIYAMKSISEAVKKYNADLGIIFDTDVDRAAIVTDDGEEINRNSLIAMIGKIVLDEYPGSVIVTDSVTSDGLTKFITENGGKHHRFKRGYKNVINESKRINIESEDKSYLAIETSGHGALKENYFLDDGTYLVAKLLIENAKLRKNGKKLQSIINNLEKPVESKEFRIRISDKNFLEYGNKILYKFEKFCINQNWEIVVPNYEGIKINFGGGWVLMRMSLHEPIIVINIELNQKDIIYDIEEIIFKFLKEQDKLDFK